MCLVWCRMQQIINECLGLSESSKRKPISQLLLLKLQTAKFSHSGVSIEACGLNNKELYNCVPQCAIEIEIE